MNTGCGGVRSIAWPGPAGDGMPGMCVSGLHIIVSLPHNHNTYLGECYRGVCVGARVCVVCVCVCVCMCVCVCEEGGEPEQVSTC